VLGIQFVFAEINKSKRVSVIHKSCRTNGTVRGVAEPIITETFRRERYRPIANDIKTPGCSCNYKVQELICLCVQD